jgi:hypothetical protein
MIADIGRLSSRYNDADVVVAMARGAGKHIAVYDPRNREIHDDYMDWSTEVRSGVGGRLRRRRCGHRATHRHNIAFAVAVPWWRCSRKRCRLCSRCK